MKTIYYLITSFAFIMGFIVYDLVLDYRNNSPHPHIAFEFLALTATVFWFVYFVTKFFQESKKYRTSQIENEKVRDEAKKWQEKASNLISGLALEADKQMQLWSLTPVEKEIAFLLIKGFSTKEIAELRGNSERTIRQHAQSIYAKANLKGRAELAAFFLEDLLAPVSNNGTIE